MVVPLLNQTSIGLWRTRNAEVKMDGGEQENGEFRIKDLEFKSFPSITLRAKDSV